MISARFIGKVIKVFILFLISSDYKLSILGSRDQSVINFSVRNNEDSDYWDLNSCILTSKFVYNFCKSSGNFYPTITSNTSCDMYIAKDYQIILNRTFNAFKLSIRMIQEIVGCQSLRLVTNSKDILTQSLIIVAKNQRYIKPNFNEYSVIATGVDDPDNIFVIKYSKDAHGNLEFTEGCSYRIVQDLMFLLNFTLKATVAKRYIHEIDNKTLGGIGEQLLNGSADIAIPLAYIVPYRSKYLSILHPIAKEPILAIFRQPDSSPSQEVYLGPFTKPLWVAIIAMWILLGVSMPLFLYLSGSLHPENSKIIKYEGPEGESGIMVFAAICQQGWHKTYTHGPIRTLTFLAFSFGFILFSAYCAAIISTLSVQIVPINNMAQLFLHNFKILTDPIVQWGRFLKNKHKSEEEVLKEIAKNYINDTTSVEQVLKGGHAFLSTLDYFIPIAQNLSHSDQFLCNTVATVQAGELSSYSGLYVTKRSFLRKPFNYGLDFLSERGLIKRHYKHLLSETVLQCLVFGFQKEPRVSPLGFRDLSAAFYTILFGIAFGLFFLMIEIFLTCLITCSNELSIISRIRFITNKIYTRFRK